MNSHRSNEKTLISYEQHVQEYIDGTPQEVSSFVKDWIDESLSYVPKSGRVLEIGSAFGRDANYIEQAGYVVRRTDATENFVDLLRSQGHEADLLNAITDDLGGPYKMVFADAVLLHFTAEELTSVLSKIYESLGTGGILAFTLKQGVGAEWSNDKLGAPRFFNYWTRDELEGELNKQNFKILKLASDDSRKWWQVISKK